MSSWSTLGCVLVLRLNQEFRYPVFQHQTLQAAAKLGGYRWVGGKWNNKPIFPGKKKKKVELFGKISFQVPAVGGEGTTNLG